MVHVVQLKLVNTYWIVVRIRGDLRTVDEDFRNWIDNSVKWTDLGQIRQSQNRKN